MKSLLNKFKYRITIFMFIIFFLIVAFSLFNIINNLPKIPKDLNYVNHIIPTEIFSSKGYLISAIGGTKTVKLENVSNHFINAVIATEDHRFWEHRGISKIRALKAILITLFIPKKVQGASTITQQLVKNLFFSFEKTYGRKLREFLMAIQIETQFSKKEILEAYINQISFSAGTYGIAQAAKFFFNKDASTLNLSEASLLAGIPKSPTRYNPYYYPKRAKKRQLLVLKRMHKTKIIDNNQIKIAYELPLIYNSCNSANFGINSYFIDTIIKYLKKNYGDEIIYHGGLKVYTTMDIQLQKFAETSLSNGLKELETKIEPIINENISINNNVRLEGAIVSIDVNTGAIRAMVGGRDFYETPFNRAIKKNRQPGSGFKPFLYYAAFENGGITPNDVFIDKKVSISIDNSNTWEPRNFGRRYKGPIIIKKAFIDSINTIAAQLVLATGPQIVVKTAHKCGITSNLKPVYSVALGTSGVSPLEMASSFSTFASGGIYKKPYTIICIKDKTGKTLEQHVTNTHRVLNPNICYQIIDMMRGVVNIGPGKIIRRMGFKANAAGKTGTTNGYKDAWFTGFTPLLSTSVWVGFDKYYGMCYKNGLGVTGGSAAAPIWTNFMFETLKLYPSDSFKIPKNISFYNVNSKTGKETGYWSNNSIEVALINKKQKKIPILSRKDRN